MTDLTEQWKEGELILDKSYYLRLQDGSEEVQMYVGGFLCNENNPVKEVLAPVPSYEELQNINKSVNDLMASNIKLVEENKHLAERLKKTQELELEVRKENTKLKELERTKKQLEIAVKRIEFLKKKTASPYYGNNTYLKTIYQMCDKTLRQIEELDK